MRLIDCFIDVLAYVKQLQKSISEGEQPSYKDVKTEVERRLADKALVYASLGYRREHYEQARFAIIAYIDEVLLSCNWQEANLWNANQLQKSYYDTAKAGEEFFNRLGELTLIDPADRDVREVYYYCLALGFSGRYFSPSERSKLDSMRLENFELLSQGQKLPWTDERAVLTPEAYPPNLITKQPKYSRYTLYPFYVGAPLLGILLLYVVMRVEVLSLVQRLVALI
ncbi:type IVB secretion system protein IcmH/DotU [Marinospirillum minutulum]|uniref:type IVB secretion system protein IcmH/DotU n=1 Tax=Marinospirillum minutulum TaxID=64974 RepID=UPI0003FE6D1F|nr:type IVB secretion system protein IcmH/DotU [Marinospirillum minutulum]